MTKLEESRMVGMTRRSFLRSCIASAAALPLSRILSGVGMGWPNRTQLPRRKLGLTGLELPVLGLGGAWWLSETNETEKVEKILSEAVESGIGFFDVYPGRCQENLSLISGRRGREKLFIASKVRDRAYDGVMRQFDQSLKELRTDWIDLLQIHHINKDEDISLLDKSDGALTALRSLRDQKAVRFVGITGHPEFESVKECIERYDDLDTLMCFVNPSERASKSLAEQIPAARRKRMGVIAMKVFGGHDPANLVGDGHNQASAQLLLRFALSEDIDVAIPAVSTLAQLRENIAAAKDFTPLTADEKTALIARVWNNPCSLRDR